MTPEESINHFKNVLVKQGRSSQIYWLFKDNCRITRSTIYLKRELRFNIEENLIHPIHSKALSDGFEVAYSCIGECNGYSLCYIWVPKDKLEMEQAMMIKGGKYTIILNQMNSEFCVTDFKFKLVKLLFKSTIMMEELPDPLKLSE